MFFGEGKEGKGQGGHLNSENLIAAMVAVAQDVEKLNFMVLGQNPLLAQCIHQCFRGGVCL